jgi:hypothetical protein
LNENKGPKTMVVRVNGRRIRQDLRRPGLQSDIRFALVSTLATVVIAGVVVWLLWLALMWFVH